MINKANEIIGVIKNQESLESIDLKYIESAREILEYEMKTYPIKKIRERLYFLANNIKYCFKGGKLEFTKIIVKDVNTFFDKFLQIVPITYDGEIRGATKVNDCQLYDPRLDPWIIALFIWKYHKSNNPANIGINLLNSIHNFFSISKKLIFFLAAISINNQDAVVDKDVGMNIAHMHDVYFFYVISYTYSHYYEFQNFLSLSDEEKQEQNPNLKLISDYYLYNCEMMYTFHQVIMKGRYSKFIKSAVIVNKINIDNEVVEWMRHEYTINYSRLIKLYGSVISKYKKTGKHTALKVTMISLIILFLAALFYPKEEKKIEEIDDLTESDNDDYPIYSEWDEYIGGTLRGGGTKKIKDLHNQLLELANDGLLKSKRYDLMPDFIRAVMENDQISLKNQIKKMRSQPINYLPDEDLRDRLRSIRISIDN